MCGRCVYTLSTARLARVANVDERNVHELPSGPCYNAGPTFKLPVVYQIGGERAVRGMEWGLKPRFKTDVHLTTNNARSESIEKSKLYAPLLNKSRCILVVDAFYEWKTEGKLKRPFVLRCGDDVREVVIPRLTPVDEVWTDEQASKHEEVDRTQKVREFFLPPLVSPLLMGGLYDEYSGVFSFAVVTMEATGEVAKIHDRMPLFLTPDDAADWLDERKTYQELTRRVFSGSQELANKLFTFEVSQIVNSIKNQGADCVLSKQAQDDKQFSNGLGRFFVKSSPPSKKPKLV